MSKFSVLRQGLRQGAASSLMLGGPGAIAGAGLGAGAGAGAADKGSRTRGALRGAAAGAALGAGLGTAVGSGGAVLGALRHAKALGIEHKHGTKKFEQYLRKKTVDVAGLKKNNQWTNVDIQRELSMVGLPLLTGGSLGFVGAPALGAHQGRRAGRENHKKQGSQVPMFADLFLKEAGGGTFLAGSGYAVGRSRGSRKHASEKVARIFGASAPSGSNLAEKSIPYDIRRKQLESYYKQKSQEKPSSALRTSMTGGAIGGGLTGAALLAAALKGKMPLRLLELLAASSAGAVVGGVGASAIGRADKRRIAHAQQMLQKGSGGLDQEMLKRIARYRTQQSVKSTADAALPAAIEQHQRTKRHGMSLSHASQQSDARRKDAAGRRKEEMLRSISDKAGAEAVSRGLFGKSLSDLNTVELATVAQRV